MFQLDRRREARRDVDLILNAYQDGLPGLVLADNLSASGIRVRRLLGPERRLAGQIFLEFQLPHDAEIITVCGEPVYRDGEITGIRFLGMSRVQNEKVRAFAEGDAPVNLH